MADVEPLTVETSAAISAFIQELSIRAEGGKAADEETLALRMLAATNASSDYDLSTIRPLKSSNAPVTAAAAGDDKFDKLMNLMMSDTKPPADQVASGQIPKPPPIIILPGYSNADVAKNYATLMDSNSMIQLYANLMQVQQKPDGFSITTEAATAYNFQAKVAYDAMMGPLAGYFVFEAGQTQNYDNTIPSDQVHEHLLGKIFDGFGFDQKTKDNLDVQLTNFVGGLKNVRTDNSPTNSIDFTLRFGLVPKKNATGDDDDPVWIYQPTMYLVYMTLDANTFYQSTGKNSGVDKVRFKFALTVTKCALNAAKFEQNRQKFDQIFELVTGSNMKAYSDLLNKQVQTNEPNPGANK